MRLSAYLEENDIPDAVFAERIGVTRQAIHRYKLGERFPEREVLNNIFRETGGAVTANDFADLPTEGSPSTAPDAPRTPERAA